MTDDFNGKLVLVTGAGYGIGRHAAQAFASRGALVYAADINEQGLAGTRELIIKAGGKATVARIDVAPQPNCSPDKDGARGLYHALRAAFPDFHADIHWQVADGDLVTTYKTYHGTHEGTFLGVPPTGRKIHFETVDAMRVRDGKITEHWGVANLFSLMQQLGALPAGTNGA